MHLLLYSKIPLGALTHPFEKHCHETRKRGREEAKQDARTGLTVIIAIYLELAMYIK